jgi:D-methionine transport system substrate-binding protein
MNARTLLLFTLAASCAVAQHPVAPPPVVQQEPLRVESAAVQQAPLRVGSAAVPQAELLRAVAPELAKQGVQLDIRVYQDYSIPNIDVARSELDANFYQLEPNLWRWRAAHGAPLVVAGRVQIEPMGIYSKTLQTLSEVHNGAVVALPDDAANLGRALALLHKADLIYVDDRRGLDAVLADVIQNPHNLKFRLAPASHVVEEVGIAELAVVNGNFALQANLPPPLFREGSDSAFRNVVVTREDLAHDKRVEALVAALRGPTARRFLREKYPELIFSE